MKRFGRLGHLAATTALALATLPLRPGTGVAASLSPAGRARLLAHVPPGRIQAELNGNHLAENLEAQLAATPADQAVKVIVRYKPGQEPAHPVGAERGLKRLEAIHSLAQRLTPREINRLAASSQVERIDADTRMHVYRETANPSFGVTKAALDFGLTGDGDGDPAHYSPQDLTIAVIDTGIDAQHQDFAGGKVIAWKDWINHRPEPYDDEGHGTHVSSIAAGAINSQGVGGVAPGASLVGLKVMDAGGGGDESTIVEAVQWCMENRQRYGIDVINLSLGDDSSANGEDPLSQIVNQAVESGIVVCCAAGNSGPYSHSIGSPAAAEKAITVGNMADLGKNGFYLLWHSSRGPTADGRVKPDLCAPGYEILAAQAGSGDGYVRMTGTSMASPFVAGVAALILQANPNLSPADVKAIMKQTTDHYGPAGENNEYGAGRLDAYAALARAAGRTGIGPTLPAHRDIAGHLEDGEDTQSWSLTVEDTRFPLALTMIEASDEADFDLDIYDSNGKWVAEAHTEGRTETVSFALEHTGVYTIVVSPWMGSGNYSLDISGGIAVD